jgi:uncharacterized protein (TIGR00251 family)
MKCLRDVAGGCELTVRVVPRASRSQIVGERDGALKVRLQAPPVDGKANEALIELLAGTLDVPRRSVTLVRGDTARSKTLRLAGLTAQQAQTKLA